MAKLSLACIAIFVLVGVWIGISAARPVTDREVRVVSGTASISFLPSVLEAQGLKVQYDASAEPQVTTAELAHGFKITQADLRFELADGHLKGLEKGRLTHEGGFEIQAGTSRLLVDDFTIAAAEGLDKKLTLECGSGTNRIQVFELLHPRTVFMPQIGDLTLGTMDAVLTHEAAQRLGRPELSGILLGTVSVSATAEPSDGGGPIEKIAMTPLSSGGLAAIDVSIVALQQLQAVGRVGTYPNGRNGLSMSTTSCNVGEQNIPWQAPMQVQHPVIAMNMYRVANGRFEQIGWSWLKHGFFATNSAGCGSCQDPGTGSLLGPGCSDTYGVFNNSDRNYLGGREEVNPFTGVWTCQNSYFSNYQNDCVRRNNGSGLDAVAHRLEVLDADLTTSNAQYYYEAFYINANDFDVYNNIANRSVTPAWGGSSWSFTTTGTFTQGPAIHRWGELRTTAQPQTEGDVIVAVQTTDLGNGMWHYEYAVYNHNLDRQIRQFSIPIEDSAVVQNMGFHDIDQNATNQWDATFGNGAITWSTAVFGSGTANPLKYSSVFNFRFDTNVAPSSTTAGLGLYKPGSGTALTAATRGPLVLSPLASLQVVNGTITAGNLDSLRDSDDNSLRVSPSINGQRAFTGIEGLITAPQGTISTIAIGVESRNTLQAAANPRQTILLWNWQTSAFDLVDSRPTTPADSSSLVSISNAAKYVNASTREVRIRVLHGSDLGETGNRWLMYLDRVGLHFN